MNTATARQQTVSPLGIVAGSGHLPREAVVHALKGGRSVFVVAIEGETSADTVKDVPHIWIKLGAIGAAIEQLKTVGVNDLMLAGKINRPSMNSLRPDAMGAKLLARLGFSIFGGDAKIFKTIVTFLEEQGFRLIGMEDVMQEMVALSGLLGKHAPDAQAQKDIELGVRVVRAVGALDVGQGVMVKNGLVLGIEAAEGTDALIERCGALKGEGSGGVLVKVRKPIQEDRVDLPTIGVQTVELMHRCGFSGIAVEAKHSLIVDRSEVIRLADTFGLFVDGISLEP